jgi:hypothetical protein
MNKHIIEAVIEQLGGTDNLQDVVNHGADAGYPGFTYYKDTCEFYKNNRKEINQMVRDMASDLGEKPVEMVGGFGCLKAYNHKADKWEDQEVYDAIGTCLFGGKLSEETTQVENALAWFALEEVARYVVEQEPERLEEAE